MLEVNYHLLQIKLFSIMKLKSEHYNPSQETKPISSEYTYRIFNGLCTNPGWSSLNPYTVKTAVLFKQKMCHIWYHVTKINGEKQMQGTKYDPSAC